jgi:ATP-dependent DNA helicase RecG
MTKTELFEVINNGENSGVEFKRDSVQNYDLAKEIVAFANFAGGVILLGVEDDGSIFGTTRPDLEGWVMEVCRTKVDPPIIPYFEWLRDVEVGKDVAIVRVLTGHNKPYARLHNQIRTYYIRVGSTSRDADQGELIRMAQASGLLHYGARPVSGSTFADLDTRRLADYFRRVLQQPFPRDDEEVNWNSILVNLELMTKVDDRIVPTIDGILLFGTNPKKYLPQSGIRGLVYQTDQPDYAAKADEDLKGPLLPLGAQSGTIVENGLVEQALDFVKRHTSVSSEIVDGRRIDRSGYPDYVLREVVVNALVHRDYSITGTDIMLTIFSDRLEVTSPGRLPNGATVDAVKTGFRYARNQTLVYFMRDYRYVDFRGMGIRYKIIPGMKEHNGTEPGFILTDWDFTVRLLTP